MCAWQLSEAVLLQTANLMFPEGQGKPNAVTKDGGAAPLMVSLLINAKAAIKSMWMEGTWIRPEKARVDERSSERFEK